MIRSTLPFLFAADCVATIALLPGRTNRPLYTNSVVTIRRHPRSDSA